jgi:lantibiotic modifying enzyme
VDEALLGRLSRSPGSPTSGDYDLINGLTGLGVCALEGLPRPTARACLEQAVERLAERAELSPEGAAWHSPVETLPDYQHGAYPAGLYDLGMSHGAAGVIALLGAACQAGLSAQAGSLLEKSVSWLLDHRQEKGKRFCFAHYHAPGAPARPSRLAWCYGDAGMAQALWIAARATGDPLWERAALDIALSAAARSFEASGVTDACLCHGGAGLAHLFGRLFQATGDERFASAGRRWLAHALDFRTPGHGAGGFFSWETRGDAPHWRDDRGFLEGAAGIGLALLAAVSAVEPEWDRALLISTR